MVCQFGAAAFGSYDKEVFGMCSWNRNRCFLVRRLGLVFGLFLIIVLLVCLLSSVGEPPATPTTNPTATSGVPVPSGSSFYPTSSPSPSPGPSPSPVPDSADFVRVRDFLPSILVDLKYATSDNITGQPIYDFSEVYLRYGTVLKLQCVQEALQAQGLGLKIWDGFRPVSAQFALWDVLPDPTFVADPTKGFSSHSRGNTVDLTLVDAFGRDVSMPTGFDDFSSLADRDYSDVPEAQAANALLLERLMQEHGFRAYYNEWWHYTDLDSYPVDEIFHPPVSLCSYLLPTSRIPLQ